MLTTLYKKKHETLCCRWGAELRSHGHSRAEGGTELGGSNSIFWSLPPPRLFVKNLRTAQEALLKRLAPSPSDVDCGGMKRTKDVLVSLHVQPIVLSWLRTDTTYAWGLTITPKKINFHCHTQTLATKRRHTQNSYDSNFRTGFIYWHPNLHSSLVRQPAIARLRLRLRSVSSPFRIRVVELEGNKSEFSAAERASSKHRVQFEIQTQLKKTVIVSIRRTHAQLYLNYRISCKSIGTHLENFFSYHSDRRCRVIWLNLKSSQSGRRTRSAIGNFEIELVSIPYSRIRKHKDC